MNKKFRILRVLFACSALFVLSMIWWSSILVEKDLKSMRTEIKELKKKTTSLSQSFRRDLKAHLQTVRSDTEPVHTVNTSRPHIDPNATNLLEPDPYFSSTLPKMLTADFVPHGIRREARLGRPENLHPFNGFRDVSEMLQMCALTVAQNHTGKYEKLAPYLAIKMEKRVCPKIPTRKEYWIHLRDDVYWQPLSQSHFPDDIDLAPCFFEKHLVTAHDFKFFYDAVMNANLSEPKAASLRTYLSDIEELRVIDDHTFVVRWKLHYPKSSRTPKIKYSSLDLTASLQPLPRFVFQYFADGQKILEDDSDPDTYRTNSVWAQNFSHHWAKNCIVSCGPYLFDGMDDEGIKFRRNSEHFNPYAVLTEGVHYTFKEGFDAVWQDFKEGKVDICRLAPNQIDELDSFMKSAEYQEQKERGSQIEVLDYVDRSYYYLGWNQANCFFHSPKVRRALTMAIDRNRIIEQNLNEMAVSTSGPFFRYSSEYDHTLGPYPYNPDLAKRLLDEEGWVDRDGDGIRDKTIDGKTVPFRFQLCYFVKSLSSKVISEYIATALREIGIDCQLSGVDITDLSRKFDDKTFDAIFMGWKLGAPPDDPRQIWHSAGAKEKGSSNAIGFANIEIDQLIEKLNYEYDHERRSSLYHAFHRIIWQEAPYTFLYTPKVRLVYRKHMKNLFIPIDEQDLISGADIAEPNYHLTWLDD